MNPIEELSDVGPLDLIDVNSFSPSNPLGDGRSVLLAGSGREFFGGQILLGNLIKADGHGDDSRPSTCTSFHPRLRQPIATIGLLLNLLSLFVKIMQLTLAAHFRPI